ncbi:MAG: alpha-E domain-containing protein [Tepidisphaeraceae bacterium]
MSMIFDPSFGRPTGTAADARPMLARDADSMFWMARYVERAEHVARLLRVHTVLLTDVGDLTPELESEMWLTILRTMRLSEVPAGDAPLGTRIARHMTFAPGNPSSILSCVAKARENARAIRESISSEMWECLNTIYWSVNNEEAAAARFEESPDDYFYGIMTGSMLFQGLGNQTMAHDQRWCFTQVAKYLERVDVTARLIESRFEVLAVMAQQVDQPIRNIHLMGVLRSACSLEAYRRLHLADLDARRIAQFLILQTDYPRSIRFSVDNARDALERIRVSNGVRSPSAPERILGRLSSQLEYTDIAEVLAQGLGAFLQQIQTTVNEASLAIQKTYFLY